MIKIEVTKRTIITLELSVTLKIIEIAVNIVKVIEGTLRIETGHMTEVEAWI